MLVTAIHVLHVQLIASCSISTIDEPIRCMYLSACQSVSPQIVMIRACLIISWQHDVASKCCLVTEPY